jgi:hypothetical protein
VPGSICFPRAVALGSLLLLACASAVAAPPEGRGPPLGRGAEVYGPVSPQLTRRAADLPRTPGWKPGDPVREVPRRVFPVPDGKQPVPAAGAPDPLLELRQPQRAPSIVVDVNIPGTGFTGATPPDTVGDVGPNHYVQAVNASTIRIFDKAGALVAGPFELDSLAPAGDSCTNGSGDPIVLYDRLADRWFLQEFRTGTNRLCIYISQTSDPTGAYYFYGFNSPTFPDYPHFGIFPQGYFAGSNENGSGGNQTTYAFDRARMLAGLPASMQRLVVVPPLSGYGFQMLTPADLDGANPPPAGTGGLFMRHFDRQAHSSPASPTDLLQMYEMQVDWDTPANTTLTALPSIAIAEFNSWFVNYTTFYSVPQPNTGTLLDPIREAILNRLVYRNFGSHETLLGNFASNRNPATSGSTVSAGIRWFELRRVGGPGNPWTLHQEGTFGGDTNSPTAQYFMGGIAMDGAGNIGLGYSKTNTSPAVFPSIGVTGRLAGDAPGTMGPEVPVVSGVQSQTSTGRWGDYANMSIDPVDDCTFWYTNEYMPGGSWGTRIVSFRFEECAGGFTLAATPALVEACALTDPEASFEIAVAGLDDFADAVELSADGLPPGTSASFVPNGLVPDFSSLLTISELDQSVTGSYTIQVTGIGADVDATVRATSVQLRLAVAAADVPALMAPAHGAVGVALTPTLTWTAAANATSYELEVASDIGFEDIVYQATVTGTSHQLPTALASATQYFWRVRGSNACGAGLASPVRHFSTSTEFCAAPGIAIPDNTPAGVNSQIVVVGGPTLTDLDIAFEARHTYIGDLIVTLNRGPTTITLMDRPGVPGSTFGCSGDDPNIIFDDASPNPVETSCQNSNPGYPVGGRFSPNQPLSVFNGGSLAGTWTLNVSDRATADTGFLDRWCLLPSPSASLAAFNDYYAMESSDGSLVVPAPGVMANDAGSDLSAALLTGPEDGNLLFDADGGFEYAPDAGFCGSDSFSYSISDGNASSDATVTITVDCTNQFPVIADQSFAVDENSPAGTVVGILVASDPDPDSVLVFSVTGGSGETAFAVDPDSGEITVADAAQLDFEAAASLTLEVTVTDDGGLAASATITIEINDVNEAPVAGPLDDQTATETLPFSFDASVAFSDPDGDALTYSAQGLPDSLAIDPATGVITGTPMADDIGTHAVVVTASDGEFEADAGFELSVVAFEPLIFRDGFEAQD